MKTKRDLGEFTALDKAAYANLEEYDLNEFYKYRDQLYDDGHSWEEAYTILVGWIWDVTEIYQQHEE